jgi:hypothetical protein
MWHMIFNRLKFGIELAFLGFLFLLPIILLLIGTPYHTYGPHHTFFKFAFQKEALPYLAIVIVALSYLVGVFMDFLTHTIFGFCLKKKKDPEEEKKKSTEFVAFLMAAPAALIDELNFKRTQNLLLRIIGFAFLFDAPLFVFWLSKLHISTLAIVAVYVLLNSLAVLSVLLFFRAYKRYGEFRKAAFELCKDKRPVEATGPGPKPPGPREE